MVVGGGVEAVGVEVDEVEWLGGEGGEPVLSLIHISEPTRPLYISYAVFCLKKVGGRLSGAG